MADQKISQLSDGGNAQAADEFVVARSGANYRIDGASVAAAATSVGTLSSLTVNGNLAVDTNTLYVDAANNRVGIGTASPATTLSIDNTRSDTPGSGFLTYTNAAVTSGRRGVRVDTSNGLWVDYYNGSSWSGQLALDASGNLGLGVTPSAWSGSYYKVIEGGDSNNQGAVAFRTDTDGVELFANSYFNGTNSIYKYTGAASLYQNTAGQHVWYTAPSGNQGDPITFGSAKMTLDASGNLGVGTTSPTSIGGYKTVTVNGTTGSLVDLMSNGTVGGRIQCDTTFPGLALYAITNNPMVFGTNAAERARITSGGYFKASNTGTYNGTNDAYHEMRGAGSGLPITAFTQTNASNPDGLYVAFTAAAPDDNTRYFLHCLDNVTSRCYIWSDGDLANHDGVYGTISDERLKQDIIDAPSQWDDLKAVRFRKYRMKTDVAADPNAPYQLGVIAQELAQTSPGLVDEHPNFEEQEVTDEDGNVTTEKVQVGTTKTVKSSILLMKAAVALQEAMARIEALEVEVAALKAGA